MDVRCKSRLVPARGTLVTTLRTLVLLFLVLSLLPQSALAQDSAPPPAPESAAGAGAGAQAESPTTAPAAESAAGPEAAPDDTCDKSKNPGDPAKVISDDEIFLVYRNDTTNPYLRNKVINFDRAQRKLVSVKDDSWSTDSALSANTWWLSAAAGDLNGTSDSKRADRVIVGLQNANGQIAAVARSSSTSTANDFDWWCQMSGDRNRCDNVQDVDVAAGNLDMSSDYSDEVVIAFRDQEADFELMTLDGKSDGNISTTADTWVARYSEDHHPGRERGDIHHFSIATGDLNGDGFDNEVVTAVKDSGSDLQVAVYRGDTLKELYFWDSHANGNPTLETVAATCDGWGNWRPIDVATGDVDGDGKDEAIAATRNGGCTAAYITLLVFDFLPENTTTHALSVDTTVPIVNTNVDVSTNTTYEAPISVSISAADLDGDGYDEIAVGYTLEYAHGLYVTRQALVAYQYFRAETPLWGEHCPQPSSLTDKAKSCLWRYTNTWMDDNPYSLGYPENGWVARVSVATGDVDADGISEIALSRMNKPNAYDALVAVFKADTTSLVEIGSLAVDLGSEPIHDPVVAMGDYDGDSYWGTYTGNCHDKMQAMVQAVIQAPPFWPEVDLLNGCGNDWNTFGQFGMHTAVLTTTEVSLKTTIGGSVTSEKAIKAVTPSFSRSFARSAYKSQSETTEKAADQNVHTTPPVEGNPNRGIYPYFTGALFIEDTQWCYDYNVPGLDDSNPSATVTVPVCLYQPDRQTPRTASSTWWYADTVDAGGRYFYPDSWVPLGANLAEDTTQTQRKASQRTTYSTSAPYGYAKLANDGNTDGAWANGSVAHTSNEVDPYWELDLGGLQWIDAVQIWNRTDCCTNQLKDFYLFVTESPNGFTSVDPAVLANDATVWDEWVSGEAGRPTTLTVGQYGRKLRIQRETGSTATVMNIAEVRVYGRPGTPDQWPKAISKTDDENFDLTWRTGATTTITRAVSRPLALLWSQDPVYTTQGALTYAFQTGWGKSNEKVEGYTKSRNLAVGIEVKRKRLPTKKRDVSIGYEEERSQGNTWDKYVEFGGQVSGLTTGAPSALNYKWSPYIWMPEAVPEGGGTVDYLMMDYVVSEATALANPVAKPCGAGVTLAGSEPLIMPEAPLIKSPTHPNPDTLYTSNAVTFTWQQPPGDPAEVAAYDWVIDQNPDTVPTGLTPALATTTTYPGVKDGTWYLHVRAMSQQNEWGDTGHRKIRVDATPPQVSLALDPPYPTGNGDWYITPVAVTVSATDPNGAGVTGVEFSYDGATWQPYTAPLVLSADSPGTTVYARATDAVGNRSEPASTAVKIDRTPPNSHVDGGAGPGTWVAVVRANSAGNDELVLAGSITDQVSGRAGMVLLQEGSDWNEAGKIGSWYPLPDPTIEVNWVYTATRELGAGYHIFRGRAYDEAGNMEETYEIGRVKWFPKASPDLGGSTLEASQITARPGDEVLFNLIARNAGFQEADVAVAATLPAGLEPVLEALPEGVSYDAATRTVTWPARLMWPGWSLPGTFRARVDAGLGATSLEIQATFHAFWPNTDLLTDPAERQQFEDREQTVVATATLVVDPSLPADADLIPPWVILLPPSGRRIAGSEVSLSIVAAPDARRMYLREWTLDPTTGDWTVAQDSGWIDYSPTYTWALSSGQGVKYLGVWMADEAGNITPLIEPGLTFVNRSDASQVLADGQRIQYRGLPQVNDKISLLMKTVSGDPDAYLWAPRNAFWPTPYDNYTVAPGEMEYLVKQFEEAGRYLLEIQAVGDSEYELSLDEQGIEGPAAGSAALQKALPEHPLTVSDPLSAGQLGPEVTLRVKSYLPVVLRGH